MDRRTGRFAGAVLSLALVAPSTWAAAPLGDAPNRRQPGSVLLFPVQRSGDTFFTVVSVTNVDTRPATPMTLGGSTLAHFEYANVTPNPADAFAPLGCTVFDRVEFLTPADTLSVLTGCHNATTPNGQEGYLVVSAQDPAAFDRPWSHNELIGSALILSATRGMYAVNAIACRSPIAKGGPTDVSPADGRLDFDGVEYDQLPDRLYIDSFLAVGRSELALVNLTGGPRDTNLVAFSIWNDAEMPLSATRAFNCWFSKPMHQVSPVFHADFLAGVPNDPAELDLDCDGLDDAETGWAIIQSLGVLSPGGALVATDGALLGSVTSGPYLFMDGGRLLWESCELQDNAVAFTP